MLIIHHANEAWEDGQDEHVSFYSKVKLSTKLTIQNKNAPLIKLCNAAKCTWDKYGLILSGRACTVKIFLHLFVFMKTDMVLYYMVKINID